MQASLLFLLAAAASQGWAARPVCSVSDFIEHVQSATFSEKRLNANGGIVSEQITAGIWTAAMQKAIDSCDLAEIPKRSQPYYIDGPLVLHSGSHLRAAPGAEIRLNPSSNTCMVRNRNIVRGDLGPVVLGENPDTNITIEGGVWTTLSISRAEYNGNLRGSADAKNSIPGAHGVILLSNVKDVKVRNLTVRQAKPFGVQISNATRFAIENLTLEDHWRDGVHVNGPASDGVIRTIQGVTHDDFIALNAWDWHNYAVTFGAISNISVEDISGDRSSLAGSTGSSYLPDGAAEIRLLPGVKRFPDGRTVDCEIRKCTFRKIRDVRTVKMYDQPNIERRPDRDKSERIGELSDLTFDDVEFSRDLKLPPFQIHANAERLLFRDIKLQFAPRPEFRLVSVGPMSATYKYNSTDPKMWVELFSPDRDCTVRSLRLEGIRTMDGKPVPDPDRLVELVTQKPNRGYPTTTPKGGTGKGILIR